MAMHELEPCFVVGSYRVLRELGKGGMGAVYEVEHVTLGVHYALKTFVLESGHAELFRNRFLAEGRLLARMSHPNLVRVFDLAYDEENDLLYYVMDLVLYKDGEAHTLADIEEGSADEDYLVRWFGELCRALAYVHAQGIVHRDIKLNNILLAPDKHVVLSDFGISKILGDKLRTNLDVSRTMAETTDAATGGKLIMGTKGYMAPEVLRGEAVTPAADVYSLGVVFFKLLTGVWYDRSLVTHGRTDLNLLKHFENRWQDILPQMLDEDPARRPADLANLPLLLQPSPNLPTHGRLSRRWPWAVAIAAALGVAAGAYFFLSSSGRRTAKTASPSVHGEDTIWLDQAFAVPEGAR